MKTEKEILDKIETVKAEFSEMMTRSLDINDGENIADIASAMIGWALSLSVLEWVLVDSEEGGL